MAERTDQRERERDRQDVATSETSVGTTGTDVSDFLSEHSQQTSQSTGRIARARQSIGRLFSIRAFLLSLVGVGTSGLLLGFVLPLGAISGFLGVFVAAFAIGLVSSDWRYLEVGIAGGLTTLVATLLEFFVFALAGRFGPVLAISAGLGVLIALVGHYLGRDLRSGLTTDL
jgi:hypothetical protein